MTPLEELEQHFVLLKKKTGEEVPLGGFLELYEALLKQQQRKVKFELVRPKVLQRYIACGNSPSSLILSYLLEIRRRDNSISTTHRKIAATLEISLPTVTKVISRLQQQDLLRKISNGTYMLNPQVISYGGPMYFSNLGDWEKIYG